VTEATVTRQINAKVWWRLAALAETRHQSVDELLLDVAAGRTVILRPGGQTGKKPGERRARVAELYLKGLSDVQIASVLGCHPQTVFYHRKKMHLAPNPAKRTKTPA
jgi:hypothetical protein